MVRATRSILSWARALSPSSVLAIDKVRWRMPIAFPSNLPALGTPSQYAAEQLKLASGGALQVRVYEPGKLVPAFDILAAVSDGKTEAGYTWIGYDQGKVPAVPLFAAVPFGLKPWAYIAWYYEGGGHDMLQEVRQQGLQGARRALRHHRPRDRRLVQEASGGPGRLRGS